MIDYSRAVVREMSIDDGEFRVGFLIYSNGAYRQFYLNDRMTRADVLREIDSVSILIFGITILKALRMTSGSQTC